MGQYENGGVKPHDEEEDIEALAIEIKQEVYEKLNAIIRLQSDAIDGLISLLLQHESVENADLAPIKQKIDEAAMISAELDY